MDRRCAIVARFIDFPPKLGGDMGKSLVRLMHKVRFLPIKGGLTKKQAMLYFSKRPHPPNFFEGLFFQVTLMLVFASYFKKRNLYMVLSMLDAISSTRFWISLFCGRTFLFSWTYSFRESSSSRPLSSGG